MALHALQHVPTLAVGSIAYVSLLCFLACGFFWFHLVRLSLIQLDLKLSPEASYSGGTRLCVVH